MLAPRPVTIGHEQPFGFVAETRRVRVGTGRGSVDVDVPPDAAGHDRGRSAEDRTAAADTLCGGVA